MKKLWLILAGTLVLLAASCSKPQTAWITDVDAARALSQKEKKDLMIVFTGSDWNDQSKSLIANAFAKDFFKKGSKKFVLCNIDIVQNEKAMDANTLNSNYKVATNYGVQSLPFVVLQTSDGDVYASKQPDDKVKDTESFLAFTDTFKQARTHLVDMKKKIKSSKGAEKAKAIDAFIESVEPARREQYADLIRQVPGLDADGKANLKGKYQLQIAYIDAIKLYEQGKMTEAGDMFIKLADGDSLNAAQKQEAWYMGAYMNAMSGSVDNAKIIEWLQKAIDSDPKNPGAAQITATIEQLKNPKVPAKAGAAAAAAKK